MEWNIEGNKVNFHGKLTETSDVKKFTEDMSKVSSNTGFQFDFSAVQFANSMGISQLMRFLQEFKGDIEYINAPIWLVNAINVIPQLTCGRFKTKSIQVPYYSEETNEDLTVTLEVGKDIPVKESYKGFELQKIEKDGDTFIADIIPENYLSFISIYKNLYT